MLRAIHWTLSLLIFGLLTSTSQASYADEFSSAEMTTDPIRIELLSEEASILPGQPFWVAIHLNLETDWHAYWKNPGDSGMPLAITWQLPEGFHAGTVRWPTPKRFLLSSIISFGYEKEVVLLASITPPDTISQSSIDIGAEVRWLVCSDSACLPGETPVTVTLPVGNTQPTIVAANKRIFEKARSQLPKKSTEFTAERQAKGVELSFVDASAEFNKILMVDFFPEEKGTFDYSSDPRVQLNPDSPNKRSVVLKEVNATPELKGILVLYTTKGSKAFEINTQIEPLPGQETVAINDKPAAEITSSVQPRSDASFEFQGGVPLALALAFIGGMILNLMPCVLPVVSFKIMSFIKMAGESRRLIFKHGLAFTGGVLLSFWVLAILLLSLQAYGRSVGWGFQLQEPIFVAILAALLFVFGLSLFGLFEIGTSMISAASKVQSSSTSGNALVGSFLSGILATAVATPCTGPFLGSAVGFAVTLPAPQALLIFTSLGLGMSFPYLLLALSPGLLRYLPKPGPWMVTFKELMGFFMMATVVWLVWVFSAQTTSLATSCLLASFFLLAVGGWIYGKWATPVRQRLTRIIGTLCACAMFGCGAYLLVWSAYKLTDEDSTTMHHSSDVADVWEEFSPARVAELQAKGIPVFIDFTSKWCLICQANHMVLSLDEVADTFAELGVVRMKADWTKRDEVITAELRKFGRNSVPLYVLYGTDKATAPQVLPQVLTPDVVHLSLKQLKEEM